MTLMVMLMVVLTAGWIQILFPPLAILALARPPLLAAVVVFYARHFPAPLIVAAAILSGLLYDAQGYMPLGTTALYYCFAGLLIWRHRTDRHQGGTAAAAILTACTAGAQTLVIVLTGMPGGETGAGLPGGWWRHLAALAIMGLAAGAIITPLIERLHSITGTSGEAPKK